MQGATGATGTMGSTMAGVAGSVGPSGSAGAQGATGAMGATGSTMAGVPGSAGPAGSAGPQGPTGAMGAQGPTGSFGPQGSVSTAGGWVIYREVWFDYDQATIRPDEMHKVSEVATYLKLNPSFRFGIDMYDDPYSTDPYKQDLGKRRVDAVRSALINAGLSADKIEKGGIDRTKLNCGEDMNTLNAQQNNNVCHRVGVLVNRGN